MPKRDRFPPPAFSNAMHAIDRPVTIEGYRKTPEWQIFIAGYREAKTRVAERIEYLEEELEEYRRIEEETDCEDW